MLQRWSYSYICTGVHIAVNTQNQRASEHFDFKKFGFHPKPLTVIFKKTHAENVVIIKAEVMDVTAWGTVPVQVITTSICRMTSLSLTTRKPSMLCEHAYYRRPDQKKKKERKEKSTDNIHLFVACNAQVSNAKQ